MKKVIVFAFAAFLACGVSAQNLKFAHIDSQELLEIFPGRDSAENVLQKEFVEMQSVLEQMQVEFNRKYQDYLEKQETMGSIAKKAREEELQDLQARVQSFQGTAQESLQRKEAELFKPIMDKAKAMIEEAGKEGGYLYVFDTSGGQVLYFSDKSIDLMPVLKKKLGL
jgi:outer membrane protein